MYSLSERGFQMQRIVPPSKCPACEAELEWADDILYCRNPECVSQLSLRIVHFAKTLKIKGLGPARVEALELTYLSDVYKLTREQIALCLNSTKVADTLFSEIENSRSASLNLLLPALSIPLIGKTASEKLSAVCKSINEIDAEVCKQAGLGPKATESLLAWKNDEYPYCDLPHSFEFDQPTATPASRGIVCISGKLKSFKTKAEASKILIEKGYAVKASMTKDVTHLVNESGIESAKTQKARQSGIIVVDTLSQLIGEL